MNASERLCKFQDNSNICKCRKGRRCAKCVTNIDYNVLRNSACRVYEHCKFLCSIVQLSHCAQQRTFEKQSDSFKNDTIWRLSSTSSSSTTEWHIRSCSLEFHAELLFMRMWCLLGPFFGNPNRPPFFSVSSMITWPVDVIMLPEICTRNCAVLEFSIPDSGFENRVRAQNMRSQ